MAPTPHGIPRPARTVSGARLPGGSPGPPLSPVRRRSYFPWLSLSALSKSACLEWFAVVEIFYGKYPVEWLDAVAI